MVIKISDEGGGIPRSHMPRIWSCTLLLQDEIMLALHFSLCRFVFPIAADLFTTATPAFGDEQQSPFSSGGDHSTDSPLAGLGYGLPISRSYARYFGGDLNLMVHAKRVIGTQWPPCVHAPSAAAVPSLHDRCIACLLDVAVDGRVRDGCVPPSTQAW